MIVIPNQSSVPKAWTEFTPVRWDSLVFWKAHDQQQHDYDLLVFEPLDIT